MNKQELGRLARRQLSDYRARTPGSWFEGQPRITLDEAYRIQHEVAQLRIGEGERAAGYKVGCTGPRIQEEFGLPGPVRGFVWESEVLPSGSTIDAGAYANLAIEGEIAVRLGPDLEPAEIFSVIELHNLIFRSDPRTLQELVANNAIHAGIVTGPAIAWSERPSKGVISVLVNDVMIDSGDMYGVPGGPEGSLDWLLGNLAHHGLATFPGAIVLTGTPLAIHPVGGGDTVRVVSEGLAEVTARIR